MTRRAVYFTGPRSVDVRENPVPEPGPDEVLVRTEQSSISPGTELLAYRGEVSPETATDETLDGLEGTFSYPFQYGYAAIGRVVETGADVGDDWVGQRVFAFNPHESHFVSDPEELITTTLPADQAILIPNCEAAVNFVMDARPRIGARVVVFGQGPVGLLTTALLAEFPLAELVTVDYHEPRREMSRSLGADRALSPDALDDMEGDADISLELSGNPDALDSALDITGYAGDVIVGSWYGSKEVTLSLGDEYHRSHIRMQSSQVSRVDPDHADRWDKDRRMDLVRSKLAERDLGRLVTHSLPIEQAKQAYELLDDRDDGVIQATLTYQ
jgi:2-desacetyl-2-hydroxyethyl bacteriochlorophyllide A dehydrogenase